MEFIFEILGWIAAALSCLIPMAFVPPPQNQRMINIPPFINTTNPAGCNKPKVETFVINPNSHCLYARVQAVATGGTPPYTYSWDGGAFSPVDTVALGGGQFGYVTVRDANNLEAISKFETKEKARFKVIFTKKNYCSESPSLGNAGGITITGMENVQYNTIYSFLVYRTFDAETNTIYQPGFEPLVDSRAIVPNGIGVNSPYNFIQALSVGLTTGNYRLIVTDSNGCFIEYIFTICDNCAEVSNEYDVSQGGCACCDDCADDTGVNINDGN